MINGQLLVTEFLGGVSYLFNITSLKGELGKLIIITIFFISLAEKLKIDFPN